MFIILFKQLQPRYMMQSLNTCTMDVSWCAIGWYLLQTPSQHRMCGTRTTSACAIYNIYDAAF